MFMLGSDTKGKGKDETWCYTPWTQNDGTYTHKTKNTTENIREVTAGKMEGRDEAIKQAHKIKKKYPIVPSMDDLHPKIYHMSLQFIWEKLWAWHILGCSAISEHSTAWVNCSVSQRHQTDEKRWGALVKTVIHKVIRHDLTQKQNLKHTHSFKYTSLSFSHWSSTTYEWGMGVIIASV